MINGIMLKVKDVSFKKAAIYKVVVKGKLEQGVSDRLLGMQISINKSEDSTIFSSLVGVVRDQAALSGILNNLYDMQMTVISVNMISEMGSSIEF